MKIIVRTLVAALAVAAAVRAEDARKAVDENNAKIVAAVRNGDATAIAAVYSEDAVVLPNNKSFVRGRSAIQQLWHGFIKAGFKHLEVMTEELTTRGDLAIEVGAFSSGGEMPDGKPWTADGKYVVIWKKVKGNWSLWRDIWNTNSPPGPPPAQAAAEKPGAPK